MRVRLDAVTDTDLSAWRDLADQAAEPNPYFRPEFVRANAIERGLPIELLVVRDRTRWLACLPIRARSPTRTLPLPYLEALTDAYSLCGTPLVHRDYIEPALQGLIEAVAAQRGVAALLIGALAADGPLMAAINTTAANLGVTAIAYQEYERAAWRRPSEGDPTGIRLKQSDRRILSKRARQMSQYLGGDLRLVVRSGDPAAWDAFLKIECSGWKAARGTALASTNADATFFRRMCADMHAAGKLDLVALDVGGQTVAMECHLVDGRTLYSFRIAYDETFRRFSPGTQLSRMVIDRFDQEGFDLADSCAAPGNNHMEWLWPDRRAMQNLLLLTRDRASHLVRPAILAKSIARRARDDIQRRRVR